MTREQRRLAAIVSADVAGYSRLMGVDESGTLAALKSHRRDVIDPKIAEYGGRIVKTTGDGLLVEFPSVVEAVRCAVDVQREMRIRNARLPAERRIDFRIGINVGDIIIDGDDIYGDGVNVAARLEALAEPGGICVSKAVRDQVVDKLRFAFEDLGARTVKNIARPVDVYRVELDGAGRSSALRRFAQAGRRWRIAGAAAAVAVLAVATAYTLPYLRKPAAGEAPALSVAVLPFSANGGSEQDRRFADAITRDLAVKLGRTQSLRVVSSRLTDGYQGKSTDAKTAGRDLGARYLVHGDVRRAADAMVVDAQVTDAATGKQLWADRFEGAEPRFDQRQGILLAQLTRRAYEAVSDSEVRRSSAPPAAKAPAIEYVLHGDHVLRGDPGSQSARAEAARWYDKALEIDPELGSALVGRIFTVFLTLRADPHADRGALIDEADRLTSRAVKLDERNSRAWWLRGMALGYQLRWDAALDANAQALRLDPTDTGAMGSRGELLMLAGRADDAIAETGRVLQMLPQNSHDRGWPMQTRCRLLVPLGRYDEGIAACDKAVASHDWWLLHVYLLAAYAHLGQPEKAAAEKARLQKLRPGFSIAEFRALRLSDSPDWLLQHETRIYPELRDAGIRETANGASSKSG
jgi:class 3 adenylate cyclase/TolB-like protein/tetratricopeptide (TPR) repeat protein